MLSCWVTWAGVLEVTESQVRISLAADEEMVSWQARLVLARESFSRSERVSGARGHRSDGGHSWQPSIEYPELTIRQGDLDGQEDELVARWLSPL